MTALKASQGLFKVTDHIKNYRPKILVLSGQPSQRLHLVDFGKMKNKKMVIRDERERADQERKNVQ